MNKLVILELDGDFHQAGFRVILDIRGELERTSLKVRGFLPPAPEVALQLHSHWHDAYRSLGLTQRIKSQRIIHKGSLNRRITNCRESATQLRDRFQGWLNAESFQPIDRRLREELSRTDTIRFLIRTNDITLQRLPWSEWDFFSRYLKAEVALSPLEYEARSLPPISLSRPQDSTSRVRILAILGHQQGINLDSDRQVLEHLPHAEVEFLVEPSRQQVSDRLWEQSWDILFFAGHSETEEETGRIYINPTDSFTLSELRYSLQKAIDHGLQLAIFNSCDGLGLARELKSLPIAQMILMREPVTDQVAQTFLRYFLNAFAHGEPLYLAARHARERLQGLEDRYPCASWLPIIYQNPLAIPPDWSTLRGQPESTTTTMMATTMTATPTTVMAPAISESMAEPFSAETPRIDISIADTIASQNQSTTSQPQSFRFTGTIPTQPPSTPSDPVTPNLTKNREEHSSPHREHPFPPFVGYIGVAVALVIMVIRFTGLLQGIELATYDHLIQLRPPETIDNRVLVVEVTQEDVNDQGGYPLTDQTLVDVIQSLQRYEPEAIALDMHRYQPRGEGRTALMEQFQQNPNLFLVCAFNDPGQSLVSQDYAPPPELSARQRLEQMGFSNFPIDGEGQNASFRSPSSLVVGGTVQTSEPTVRRHLLTYDPALAVRPSSCTTPFSLSFQLAYASLRRAGITPLQVNEADQWHLGKVVFHPLRQRFGGYQNLDGRSNQVMLNFRSTAPGQRVSLQDVLQGKVDASLVHHCIVLVGYTAPVARDTLKTPYGSMAGVWVHAHMISQILSAVRDQRPLIWALPQWRNVPWGDGLWVIVWSVLAGGVVHRWRSQPWRLGIAIALLVIGIHQISLLVLMQGGWLPLIPTLLSVIGVGLIVVGYSHRRTGRGIAL